MSVNLDYFVAGIGINAGNVVSLLVYGELGLKFVAGCNREVVTGEIVVELRVFYGCGNLVYPTF